MPNKRFISIPDGNNGRRLRLPDRNRLSYRSSEDGLLQRIEEKSTRRIVTNRACRHLAPRELAVFSILLAGGSYHEASCALGMTVPACRSAMASAKKKLRKGL